jgi:hypothetical protein
MSVARATSSQSSGSSSARSQPGVSGRRRSPTSNWYSSTPSAYRSLRTVAGWSSSNSGARYSGVPEPEPEPEPVAAAVSRVMPSAVMPSARSCPGSSRRLLPKSVSRTWPASSMSTLSGLISLCSTPTSCAAWTARATRRNNASRPLRSSASSRPSAAHPARLRPPYSASRKKGARSKFQSSTRAMSARSPRLAASTRATVASRFRRSSRSALVANLNTRFAPLRGCRASHTSLACECPSGSSSRKFSRPGTGRPCASASSLK